MALAFFPVAELPKLEKSSIRDMSMVDLAEVRTGVRVDFNGFINLKKNDKMILYVKNGRSISDKQKSRLLANNIDKMYIRDEEAESFYEQMARVILNEKIDQYKQELEKLGNGGSTAA